ncbi:4814_t:CDS:1, partial [Funneliformis mosseae]
MKEIGEEVSNFLMNRTITWKSQTRSFQYYIIEEGFYPPYLAYTRMPNHYPIPDNYIVETTYGKNMKTVTCSINYYNEKPLYEIKFGHECVYSDLSPTAVA